MEGNPGATGGLFTGTSEMAALMRATDWSATALGPESSWPASLRTMSRLLLSSDAQLCVLWGPDLVQLYNDAFRQILGAKHPAALGQAARECWREVWDVISPMYAAVLAGGATAIRDGLLVLDRHGYLEECYFDYTYSPLHDDSAHIVGLLAICQEVTDRVLGARRLATLRRLAEATATTAQSAEEACAAAAAALAENAADVPFALIYLLDDDGASARLAGLSNIDANGVASPPRISLGDAQADDAVWPLAQVIRTGEPEVVRDLVARVGTLPGGPWPDAPHCAIVLPVMRAGQTRPYGVLVAGVSPRRSLDDEYRGFYNLAAGHVAAAVATARAFDDERRRAEALAQIDRAKTAFFQNVSHELRTPLTLILGPVEDALTHSADVPQPVRESLSLAQRSAVRLSKLVNSLLDFSRIEAGRVRVAAEPTDLATFTADIASLFRSTIERGGLALVVDTLPLPAQVQVDREMWERVVLNLLSNAFKHTFAGEIRVRLASRAGNVVLEIADTGVGIAADQLPRVFERFHRVPDAYSRTNEGTGIGLALVQELVRLHSGTVDVRSEVGSGTTFSVTIPMHGVRASQPVDASERDARREDDTHGVAAAFINEAERWISANAPTDVPVDTGSATTTEMVNAHVVLADDNADMRQYVTRLLQERGWTVESVADGTAALNAVRARRPDLVLADVMMPGLDGFALLKALQQDPATQLIPVLLLSARAGEEARVEGIEAGAADYIVKPFSARELVARIDHQLHRVQAAASAARIAEERRSAETRERVRLETLFSQAPVAICVFRGPDHVIALANDFYRRLVPAVSPGRRLSEILPEAETQGYVALLSGVLETGQPWEGRGVELLYDRHGTGTAERAYFNALYYPLVESGGIRSGVIAVVVEVTAEVHARREAESARREAEIANRAKGEFLAAMSHELRTPLNAIGGYAQLLDMGLHGPVTSQQHEALDRLQRSQQRLLSLINDVLNFAKLEAGHVEYHFEQVSLSDAVAAVVPVLEPQAMAKGISCEVAVDPDIHARADREKLEQILLNLLSNAVKFTEKGGQVVITADQDGDSAQLRVRDTGRGIAASLFERIFDPFVQIDARLSREAPGTGLGLAISRDLARGMGGDLTVVSDVGVGSAFTIHLPK